MERIDVIKEAKRVFDIEIAALEKTRDALDGEFEEILKAVISCTGKVIITGMGKPGHIGEKLAATFSSLGTPSFFLHPAEAMHGDLGMVAKDDVFLPLQPLYLFCCQIIFLLQPLYEGLVIERHIKPLGQFLTNGSATRSQLAVDGDNKFFVQFHILSFGGFCKGSYFSLNLQIIQHFFL